MENHINLETESTMYSSIHPCICTTSGLFLFSREIQKQQTSFTGRFYRVRTDEEQNSNYLTVTLFPMMLSY